MKHDMKLNELIIYTGSHPNWKYEGPETFLSVYSEVANYFYDTKNQDPHPVNFSTENFGERVCAICGKSNPEVTFDSEAHIIPASLGNRIYFSLEECDECNNKFGREFEDHLARKLEPHRAMFRIPSREGPPKWSNHEGGKHQIEWTDQGFVMKVGDPTDSVSFKHNKDDKSVEIEGPAKPYRPVNAINSLLHTCWLFLDKEQRDKHKYVLDILKGKLKIAPLVYYDGFFPGNLHSTIQFQIFEKSTDNKNLPDLILILSVGHQILMWAAPLLDGSQYKPFPSPEIPAPAIAPPPTMIVIMVNDLDAIVDNKTEKFMFTYSGIVDPKKARNDLTAIKTSRKKNISVKLKIKDVNSEINLNGLFMKAKNSRSSDPKLMITGPRSSIGFTIAASKLIPPAKPGETMSMNFDFRPGGKGLDSVTTAIEAVEKLLLPGSIIELYTDKDEPIYTFDNPTGMQLLDFSFEKKVVTCLGELGYEIGCSFDYPKIVDDQSLKDLKFLYDIFVEKIAAAHTGEARFSIVGEASEENILKIKNGDGQVVIAQGEKIISLFGKKIKIPAFKGQTMKIEDCALLNDIHGKPEFLKVKYLGMIYSRQ